jgi:hypothetical protein
MKVGAVEQEVSCLWRTVSTLLTVVAVVVSELGHGQNDSSGNSVSDDAVSTARVSA